MRYAGVHVGLSRAQRARDRPRRLGDLAGAEGTRRDLLEERLEEMEVAPVDERQRDLIVTTQPAGGVESAEPTAADQDPMPIPVQGRG
jgi:hypothetical protein